MKNEKIINIMGRLASALSILMYVSYIPQIMNNLQGNKGNPIQPLVAAFNGLIWTIYGFSKKEKDYPIIFANIPAIIFGLIAFITSL